MKKDKFEEMTARIIAQLEKASCPGVAPGTKSQWVQP